jgi:5-methylthioadenosine/S-adenosylhomocysteine deaminase
MLLLAKWVLPISGDPIEDGGVLVRDGRIEAVGPRATLGGLDGEDVRDFGQAVVMPGFVDLHTHLAFSAFRGLCDDLPYARWKLQVGELARLLDAADWRASARLGALEAMRSGITCVANMSPDAHALEAVLESGLRGMIYREVEGMGTKEAAANLAEAEDFLDGALELASTADGRIEVGIAPHSPYSASADVYTGCTRIAKERGLPVATHLAGSRDEYQFVKYGSSMLANEYRRQKGWQDVPWQPTGVSPVKYVQQWQLFTCDRVLAAHGIHVSDDDIQILARFDVAIAHCPRCAAKLGMGIAPMHAFTQVGLRVGLGTDSPASNNTMDPFDEMRIGLLIQRAANQAVDDLSAARFVRMATLGGAEALGLHERIGSLEPGKEADVIAVDLSHSHQLPTTDPYSALVYTANQEDVAMTMVAGRVLWEGTARTLCRDEVVADAEPVRAKLRG